MKAHRTVLTLSLVSLIYLCSCGNDEEQKIATEKVEAARQDSLAKVQAELEAFNLRYRSIIDELRVRSESNTKSEVVGELSYDQPVLFLNEESDFKEKITLRGISRTDSWKKIKFSNGDGGGAIEGWVFGGGLIQEASMYEKNDDLYVRNISQAKGNELSDIIQLDLDKANFYNGHISYKKTSKDSYVKEGKFSIIGKAAKPVKGELKVTEHVSGEYVNGTLNGVLKREIESSEGSFVFSILYENGTCTTATVEGKMAGTEIYDKIENPESCDFQFLEKSLKF